MARLEYHTCPIVYASVLQRCLYNQLKLVDAISFFRGKIRKNIQYTNEHYEKSIPISSLWLSVRGIIRQEFLEYIGHCLFCDAKREMEVCTSRFFKSKVNTIPPLCNSRPGH